MTMTDEIVAPKTRVTCDHLWVLDELEVYDIRREMGNGCKIFDGEAT